MSRISDVFKRGKAFIAFVTGGDPDMETSERLILEIEAQGADIIEIGIPFSDPIAEGPVIQEADERALRGGATTDSIFDMAARVRSKTSVPLVFMTYLNPIFTYGKEKFLDRCRVSGIDGLIVPDMPFEEKDEIADACEAHGIELISMIAPTSSDRISMIAREAKGFLYCVSSLGVTGVRSEINSGVGAMIEAARAASDIPCAVGFGVSTPEQAAQIAGIADGVIVGSAIVRIVAEYGRESVPRVGEYVREMKKRVTG